MIVDIAKTVHIAFNSIFHRTILQSAPEMDFMLGGGGNSHLLPEQCPISSNIVETPKKPDANLLAVSVFAINGGRVNE